MDRSNHEFEGFGDGEAERAATVDHHKVQTTFLRSHHAYRGYGESAHARPKQRQSRQRKTKNPLDRRDQNGNRHAPKHTPRNDPTSSRLAEVHHGSHQRSATDLTGQGDKVNNLFFPRAFD